MTNFTVPIREHGRLNLPKRLREALGISDTGELVFTIRPDGVAEVVSAQTLAQRSTGLFSHLKVEDSETDAFIAERRAEADR
ncbi:AbrB/MazE/SpoVT family DNA-binding domain-containing protein [Deinococcus sp. SL84]|uniref:AbrB/MazE/SpoVT family DNA-binding domain-containing protein n=1 Tax=Deinococcus sp. SL84 TaxID=2994663 RepID=UPI002275375D|nr:AbrB/MazE/SpoVT family DNA-binding domain-containing protein [Deinococcus sp. SL84]MCY1703706.1 AbrB/MazE/SpoVT family DNA-binding domain-containing protein [Deinococcus sp. SL84]